MATTFDTTEMRDLRKKLNNGNNHVTTTTVPSTSSPSMRRDVPPMRRPYVPHTAYLKEFNVIDGRKILIDKRAVAFICQRREEPEKHCIVAFKSGSMGVPIAATYSDLSNWWRSTPDR
jgi:hypothetical protein